MPTYTYQCLDCDTNYEEKRSFAQLDEPSICPSCESRSVQRMLSRPYLILRSNEPAVAGGGCACSSGGVCACQ